MSIRRAELSIVFKVAVARGRLFAVVVAMVVCLAGSTSVVAQCVPPDCDDGLFCTVDICSAGLCFNNTRSCQDSSFCNGVELCDENRDLCEFACLDGGTCTDGVCVGGSNPGANCDATITPINCPEGTVCSESRDACVECLNHADCGDPGLPFCEPSSGSCVACYQNSHCNNGLFCDGSETCNLSTNTCEDGTPVQCSLNPPTFCSEIFSGSCVECETAADCSGGTFCNPKACSSGSCVDGAAPVCKRCIDGSGNQSGACDDTGDCPGGFTCDGASSFCSDVVGRCVLCLEDANCEDLNFCTQNECSKLDFTCQYPPDGANKCAELNGFEFCQGPELCVNQIGVCNPFTGEGCCQPGTPPATDDGVACTIDSCDEQNDVILHQPSDAACDDALFCSGVEVCDPNSPSAGADGCVAGVDVDCSHLNAQCRVGKCDEPNDVCTTDINVLTEGESCDDGDPCTAASACGNQTCNEVLPEPNDPYRCVEFEWRNGPAGPLDAQTEFTIDLFAKANGCSLTPSGASPADDACVALGGHPIFGLKAVLDWDSRFVELAPVGLGNPNPVHTCFNPADPCFSCPAGTYNWAQSGFFDDCAGDGLNDPCSPTAVPANDGDAVHEAFSYPLGFPCCSGCTEAVTEVACVSPAGLYVATFRFTARSGGTTGVGIAGCGGEVTGSKVNTRIPRPMGYINGNVLNGIGPAWPVEIICNGPADCDDQNACTDDTCVGGSCVFSDISATCDDTNACTDDSCDPIAGCQFVIDNTNDCNDANVCNGTETCVGGTCTFGPPLTCNDDNVCTDDSCDAGLGCQFAANSGPCDDGEYCTGVSDICVSGVCVGSGTPCGPGEICDELNDVCFAGCVDAQECDDGDLCTDDVCAPPGICQNPSICPAHPDPCIINTCSQITFECGAVPVSCGAGEECYRGDCFEACETTADCDDAIACTTDSCVLVTPADGQPIDICFHVTDDALCETGLFCAQQRCDQELGCVAAHECVSATGNPCPDQAACDEGADDCGGCLAPAVEAVGSRYLAITPQDQGATSLALLVAGACGDSEVECVSSYVQSLCFGGFNRGQICQTDADCPKQCELGNNHLQACTFNSECSAGGGTCIGSCTALGLGPAPSFHPASFWGEANVGSLEIHPSTTYEVRTVCDFAGELVVSAGSEATTRIWGDTDGSGTVNVFDVVTAVDGVKLQFNESVTFEGVNLLPCIVGSVLNVQDIVAAVDAVKSVGYPCAGSCP